MKKCIAELQVLVLTLAMALSAMAMPAFAAASGVRGTVNWTLDDNGHLVLSGTGVIYQPDHMDEEWIDNVKTIDIGEGITEIGPVAFELGGCIIRVKLPESLTKIGGDAFYLETNLEEINIPNRMTEIGEGAFFGCRKLTGITLPDGMTTIGEMAFLGPEISSITIPASVTTIGEWGLGYHLTDNWETEKIPGFTIYGCAGTEAERYAKDNGFTFIAKSADIAYPSVQKVNLDGKTVEFRMYALKDAAGNMTNYIKARDLALVLNGTQAQFNIGWDGAVNLVPGTAYAANGTENATPFSGERPYTMNASPTNVNGAASDLAAFVLTDDAGGGYTYYQLRDLGRKLGFNVGWSNEKGVFVETDKPYTDAD